MEIRSYKPSDYDQLKSLYLDSSTFGGQFDEARDAAAKLRRKIEADPGAILVALQNNKIIGTVSLIEDGRVAWLFRFAVLQGQDQAARALYAQAVDILKQRGHQQVLVYSPVGNHNLDNRYHQLGFAKGDDYTCYWQGI